MLVDLAGLLPSAVGRRVRFSGGNRTVIEGAFPDPRQVVAGYWTLQVASVEEAVEWAERFPFEALSRIYPGEYGTDGDCSNLSDEPPSIAAAPIWLRSIVNRSIGQVRMRRTTRYKR